MFLFVCLLHTPDFDKNRSSLNVYDKLPIHYRSFAVSLIFLYNYIEIALDTTSQQETLLYFVTITNTSRHYSDIFRLEIEEHAQWHQATSKPHFHFMGKSAW